jgi:ech hydrogenase subunit C
MSKASRSPWVLHYDAASCNGCDIEVLACLTPVYDAERLGLINTGNPKHADILLITGGVNAQNRAVVESLYAQMLEPKAVVAIGACALSGGIFRDCYNVRGGVDTVIPVDVYVPGCAARPQAIIEGVAQALGVLSAKEGGTWTRKPKPAEGTHVTVGLGAALKSPAVPAQSQEAP